MTEQWPLESALEAGIATSRYLAEDGGLDEGINDNFRTIFMVSTARHVSRTSQGRAVLATERSNNNAGSVLA